MTPQLSIYWQGLDRLTWRWQSETTEYRGRWDELVDQRRERNHDQVATRLYLPHDLFTSLTVRIPAGQRRVSHSVLRFAAEEQLAQDIDGLHVVALDRPANGLLPVLVIERERLQQLRGTLAESGFELIQALDAGWFQLPNLVDGDIQLDVEPGRVLCRCGWLLHQIHPRGFAQWFEAFKEEQGLGDAIRVTLTSRSSDDLARQLYTELEAAGERLDWLVTEPDDLADWDERCRERGALGNLMVGEFAPRRSTGHRPYWQSTAVAAGLALVIWLGASGLQAWRDHQAAEATWAASEAVFRQVFGDDKRIQRPLMERELDNRILENSSDGGDSGSVLEALRALSSIDSTLSVEDLRYQRGSGEMLFTLRPDTEAAGGDAFARFEAAKTTLEGAGYQVEYSASQENERVRGRFQAIPEAAS